MKFPRVVRNPKQTAIVSIGKPYINEDGETVCGEPKELKCYVQMNAHTKLDAEKHLVTLSGKALFDGDIAPEQPTINEGTFEFEGTVYEIYSGQKNYNPDGTINFTTLELK